VKTGWTIPAGHCYVGSATWGNWRLISVVLKSPDYVHETSLLMKYGFENFEAHRIAEPGDLAGTCDVASGMQPSVPIQVQKLMQFVTRKGDNPPVEKRVKLQAINAPVAAGTTVGTLEAWSEGKLVASSPLVTADNVAFLPSPIPATRGNLWGKMALGVGIFATGLVSLRYGKRYGSRFAALTKGARRRRSRLAARLRDPDNGG
ncbi:MAG TPA: hypothetical protein VKU00_04290, partial [Chthonomonadaceae bacterium]|nr:hypothetical protein [Chthonomonadaceae bacterium]